MDLTLKSTWIVDFCGKSSGLTDFENTLDRGSAVILDADSRLWLFYAWILGPKQTLDQRSFLSLGRNVNELIQVISVFKRSSFKLRCETVIGIALCYSHQACCLLHIWAKLTVAFTCTSLPWNLYSSVFGCGCGFGFEQKFWWINGFGEKKRGSVDLHTPIHPPLSW